MTTQPPGDRTTGDKAKVLGERYEVGELIGRGGMADVREGHDSRLGRTVAIKRLRSDLASDPTFQARFRREAQSAASLNHPAIVAVYDTGEEVVADGTHVPYIVMEHVEGQTLRDILRAGGKILPQRALEITAEVLSALDYSHRAGIVHRDIKPANVMLTPSGRVKVMDFGIARAIADASSTMTATAAVVGTAQYLSPEQARGEQVDARSDIYSTGCLLFELLTGRPPFQGDSPVSVAYQHVREEAPIASSLEPEVSPQIDAIVAQALAKKTSDRYQSAAQMRADIERALAGQAVDATATSALPAAAPVPPPSTSFLPEQDEDEDDGDKKKSRAWIWVLLALLLLLGLGVAAWALVNTGGEEGAPTATVPNVVGDSERQAVQQLEELGFEVETENRESEQRDAGDVLAQSPEADEEVAQGSTVTLAIGAGPNTVTVPALVGETRAEAEALILDAGLEVGEIEQIPDTARQGTVLASNPASGEPVREGETVDLQVSAGPVSVPDVLGFTEEDAIATLEEEGFSARVIPVEGAERDVGTVVAQSPEGETEVEEPGEVVIDVVQEPETTTTEPTTEETTEETEETEEPTVTPTEPTTGPPTDPGTPPTEDRAQPSSGSTPSGSANSSDGGPS